MHGTFGEGGIDFRTGQDGQLSGGAGFSRRPTRFVVVRGNGGNRPLGSGSTRRGLVQTKAGTIGFLQIGFYSVFLKNPIFEIRENRVLFGFNLMSWHWRGLRALDASGSQAEGTRDIDL